MTVTEGSISAAHEKQSQAATTNPDGEDEDPWSALASTHEKTKKKKRRSKGKGSMPEEEVLRLQDFTPRASKEHPRQSVDSPSGEFTEREVSFRVPGDFKAQRSARSRCNPKTILVRRTI